jgi:hypothetical protein
MHEREPIHVTVPGNPDDPRFPRDVPDGIVVHYVPELHPDDVCVVDGIPTTSPSRTLIDLAEVLDATELRECFENARVQGLLDLDELDAARARVEWRPSLAMFDEVAAEFR